MNYLLQVLGTYYETSADTVDELVTKGSALKARHNLSGFTYRIFKPTGKKNVHGYVEYRMAKEGVF